MGGCQQQGRLWADALLLFLGRLGISAEQMFGLLSDAAVLQVVQIVISSVMFLLPFFIVVFGTGKKLGEIISFGAPDKKLFMPLVLMGFGFCTFANIATNTVASFFSTLGFEYQSPQIEIPEGVFGFLLVILSTAITPALVEEFAIRGAVMQPLRKYGDWFAIIASSIVFAVLHGNLIQAPFALIAGIGIGYAVCITESLWTGIIIHFCNNFYAVVTEFMIADIPDENMLNKVYYISLIVLYAVSIIGSAVFMIIKNKRTLKKPFTALTAGRKFAAFMLSVPMVIALLIMLYFTSQYVEISLF